MGPRIVAYFWYFFKLNWAVIYISIKSPKFNCWIKSAISVESRVQLYEPLSKGIIIVNIFFFLICYHVWFFCWHILFTLTSSVAPGMHICFDISMLDMGDWIKYQTWYMANPLNQWFSGFWSGLVWSGLVLSCLVWSGLVWSSLVTIDDRRIFKVQSNVFVSPASRTTKQPTNYTNIVSIQFFFVWLLDQGLFCHDQVSSGKFLEFFNLWCNLQIFLDTMDSKTENKNSSLEMTVLIMWAQICGIITKMVHKMTLKKIICKIGTTRG